MNGVYCNVSKLYTRYLSVLSWGRLGSVVVKTDAHSSARRRRRIHEGLNPANDYKILWLPIFKSKDFLHMLFFADAVYTVTTRQDM